MFAMGRDADFEGLKVAAEVTKVDTRLCPRGRDILLNQVVENLGE